MLLLDDSDRILLFRHEGVFQVGDSSGTALWAPPVSNQTDQERLEMTTFRWWTREEIAAAEDLLVPRDLAELLGPILLDEYTDEPLRLGI